MTDNLNPEVRAEIRQLKVWTHRAARSGSDEDKAKAVCSENELTTAIARLVEERTDEVVTDRIDHDAVRALTNLTNLIARVNALEAENARLRADAARTPPTGPPTQSGLTGDNTYMNMDTTTAPPGKGN